MCVKQLKLSLSCLTQKPYLISNLTLFSQIISELDRMKFAKFVRYGLGTLKNYIVILDTNLNIIHRSPQLGEINNTVFNLGMTESADSTFYLVGSVMNSTNNGQNIRVYSYKIGDTAVKVQEIIKQQLLGLYPNPAKTNLTVSTDGGTKTITVYNTLGQAVYADISQGLLTIDVSSWFQGVYLVEIVDANTHKKEMTKFIKE